MPQSLLISDYITLCKPRVVALMLVTMWVGMFLAQSASDWQTICFASIGIAAAASAAAVFNHLLDRRIDKKMSRTATRPIAAGRITPLNAAIFAVVLSISAWLILTRYVNLTTAWLTFATFIGYAGIYTLYLKRATPQNIVIGGLAGAMPPLLGWAAVTNEVNPYGLLLVLIIFTWTPPHFWALAIYRVKDYANANIPMLPVTHGVKFTKLSLLLYTILLTAVTCLPYVTRLTGLKYLIVALILNAIFLLLAIRLYFAKDQAEHKLAIRTFNFSIFYLLLLFVAMLFDHHTGA